MIIGAVGIDQPHPADPEPEVEELAEDLEHSRRSRFVDDQETAPHLAGKVPVAEFQKPEVGKGHRTAAMPGGSDHALAQIGIDPGDLTAEVIRPCLDLRRDRDEQPQCDQAAGDENPHSSRVDNGPEAETGWPVMSNP